MPTGLPTPTPKPIVCFDPFNIPTKDLKDINWWMLQDQVNFFDNDDQAPIKKNILASNSNIHDELRDLIHKKNIE